MLTALLFRKWLSELKHRLSSIDCSAFTGSPDPTHRPRPTPFRPLQHPRGIGNLEPTWAQRLDLGLWPRCQCQCEEYSSSSFRMVSQYALRSDSCVICSRFDEFIWVPWLNPASDSAFLACRYLQLTSSCPWQNETDAKAAFGQWQCPAEVELKRRLQIWRSYGITVSKKSVWYNDEIL